LRSWFRRQLRGLEAPEKAAQPAAPKETEEPEATPEPESAARPGKPVGSRRRRSAAESNGGTAGAETETKSRTTRSRSTASKVAAEATKAAVAAEGPARKPRERRRRIETPRRSTLPPVRKAMLISVEVGEQRVAVLEDGQPVEVYLERPGRRSIAGNVYKGVVDNVLPGMEAAFIEIGLEKNGFLYVDEIVTPELEGRRHARRIQDLISRGQEILVQAVKDPMGTKGARLTTEVSLPGRFIVYTPFGDGIGVSRRLEDEERERLKALCRGLDLPEGGIIVRTAAEGASEEELAGDLAFLRKLWATIKARAERATAPALVYREADLPLRVVRDLFVRDFERLAVDNERAYRRIVSYLRRTSPELASKVELYRDVEPLMDVHGVDAAVRSTLNRRVDLPSGGYLVFDYAEAFTVIDVNTGRFVGARGRSSGARLEDTITKNNLEAAKEIVRQLRLRDIGGIIVIDFIDMANPKNRAEVEEALKRELERDRTKTYVVEISPLGLVEMTRQNVTEGPREILTKRCEVCDGSGVVVSEETFAVDAERRLRWLARTASEEAFLIELHVQVAGILIGPAGSRLAQLERETGKLYAFETREDVPLDHFAVLARGAIADIEPKALPVAAGAELDVRLEEVHMHNRDDAIARLDGYVISVAGAARDVGKTIRVRIERATRTAAYAVPAGQVVGEEPVEPGELAEATEEAEQAPARARRRAAPRAKAGGPARAKAAAAEPFEAEAGAVEAERGEEAAEEEKPKRKTRRGTRGGRGRKKKPAEGAEAVAEETATAPEGADGAERAAEPDAQSLPKEPGSSSEAAGEPEPQRKTRRGSRGGRGRKRPVPVEASANGAEPAVAAEPVSEEAAVEVEAAGKAFLEAAEDGAAETAPRRRTRRGTRGGRGRKLATAAARSGEDGTGEPEAAAPLPQ
jgi:ribonuclease G